MIKVAIAGVGNCASSLVQGVEYYRKTGSEEGLITPKIGEYKVTDIQFVAAFDINANKVGKDLNEAIFAEPNNTWKITDVPRLGVEVKKGPVLDGIGKYVEGAFQISEEEPVDVAEELRRSDADVLVNYMPVGSQKATEYYARAAMEAGVAFVNAMPVFIASNPEWAKKFENAGVPVIGDDIKSQVGATIVHRNLMKLFFDRGVEIENSYQLNFGGNTDFLNMLERERLKSKKVSKTEAVNSQVEWRMNYENLHIGPSDYIPFLKDRKIAFMRIEGKKWGGAPVILDLRLQVEDSPNSAAVIADVIRLAKISLDRKLKGAIIPASVYYMKHPPIQVSDSKAQEMVKTFIQES